MKKFNLPLIRSMERYVNPHGYPAVIIDCNTKGLIIERANIVYTIKDYRYEVLLSCRLKPFIERIRSYEPQLVEIPFEVEQSKYDFNYHLISHIDGRTIILMVVSDDFLFPKGVL